MPDIVHSLMDSKRFCDLFKAAGVQWNKRSLTQEDRERLLLPIIEMVVERIPGGVPEELRNDIPVHKPRVSADVLARKPDPSGITIHDDAAGLGFDPFKQNDQPNPLSAPLTEPNPVTRREQMVAMLKEKLASIKHDVGQRITIEMPMDWNVQEAALYCQALGTHTLAADPSSGSFGTRMKPKLSAESPPSAWEVSVLRIK